MLAPTRAGKRHNLAKLIKQRVSGDTTSNDALGTSSFSSRKRKKVKSRSLDELLASMVSSKIEEGNLKGAVRMLCSDEKLAEVNDYTYNELCRKHPQSSTTMNASTSSNNEPYL